MPSADFCAAIRRPFDLLSRQSDTAQTSRGKTNSLPHPPPNLRSAHLVDMDFVVDRPLVRRSRLISGSCSSVHAFAPRFLQTPPRDDALALRYPFTSTWLGRGLSPPSCRSCPAHDLSTRSLRSLGRDDIAIWNRHRKWIHAPASYLPDKPHFLTYPGIVFAPFVSSRFQSLRKPAGCIQKRQRLFIFRPATIAGRLRIGGTDGSR